MLFVHFTVVVVQFAMYAFVPIAKTLVAFSGLRFLDLTRPETLSATTDPSIQFFVCMPCKSTRLRGTISFYGIQSEGSGADPARLHTLLYKGRRV